MIETRPILPVHPVDASVTLLHIIDLAAHDLPFAAQVAQLAFQGDSLDELASALDSLYRISIDHGHSFLPDLVDSVLRLVEDARDAGTPGSTSWRAALAA